MCPCSENGTEKKEKEGMQIYSRVQSDKSKSNKSVPVSEMLHIFPFICHVRCDYKNFFSITMKSSSYWLLELNILEKGIYVETNFKCNNKKFVLLLHKHCFRRKKM